MRRTLADANIPDLMIRELSGAGVDVVGGEASLHGKGDDEVVGIARGSGRVLLTLDQDFWDDRKHPLHQAPGIIVLAVSKNDLDAALHAFGLVYACFAKEYPGDCWWGVKVKASRQAFFLRVRSYRGRAEEWQIKLRPNKTPEAREIEGISRMGYRPRKRRRV